MNERIKELAYQATITRGGMRVVDIEKFAELIVRKCAQVGERYADGNYEVYNQILEHFGIEE
jgi:hypothetical protein